METVVAIIAVIAGIVGILGSILPALPGPPLSWVGMLLLYFWGGTNGKGDEMSLTLLLVMLGVTVAVSIFDYYLPAYITKKTGGSKYAEWGALIGMFVGMFFSPLGMILCSFLAAFFAEVFFNRNSQGALKVAFGSFIGFLLGTGIKLAASGVMMYYIIVYL